MKLLIDANILLDVLQNRKPHVKDSSLIWKLCEIGRVEGCVPSFSFVNLIYIMRKEMDAPRIEAVQKSLGLIFSFTDLRQSDLEKAAALCWKDYEDALQAVTAERIGADYIVTRNTKDYADSPVAAVTPRELLQKFKGEKQ